MKHLKKFKSWGEWMEDRRNVQYSPTIAYIEKEDEVIISEGKTGREAYYGAMPDNMLAINDKSNLEWLMIDGESIDLSEPIVEKTREYTTNWQFVEDATEFYKLNKDFAINNGFVQLELRSSELAAINWDALAPYLFEYTAPDDEELSEQWKLVTNYVTVNNGSGNLSFIPIYYFNKSFWYSGFNNGIIEEEDMLVNLNIVDTYGLLWTEDCITISENFLQLLKINFQTDFKLIFIASLDEEASVNQILNTTNTETYKEGSQINFTSEGNHIVNFEFKDKTTIGNIFKNTCIVSFNDSALESVERINKHELSCPYLQAITFGESLVFLDSFSICTQNLKYVKFLGKCPNFIIAEESPTLYIPSHGTIDYPKNYDYSYLIENTSLSGWANYYVHGHMMRYISEEYLGTQQLFNTIPYKMFVNGEEVTPTSFYEFTEAGCYKIDFVLKSISSLNISGEQWIIWLDDKFYGDIYVDNNTFLYKTTEFDFYQKRFKYGRASAYDVKFTIDKNARIFGSKFDKSQINYVITDCLYDDGVISYRDGTNYYNDREVFVRFNTLQDCSHMFHENNAKFADLKGMDTSLVTNMSYMFASCDIAELNLQNFNTFNVTDMSYMFSSCTNAHKIDVSSFNTSNVTNMSHMFEYTPVLELDVSNFITSNVTDMSYMFFWNINLEKLDVSNFDTSNVTNMEQMFFFNLYLNYLDLSNWNTEKVTNMDRMFCLCDNLKTIDLSNFSFKSCENFESMFGIIKNWELVLGTYVITADKLKKIIINWDKEGEIDSNMFADTDYKNILLIYNGKHNVSNLLNILPYSWTAIPQLW